MHAIPKIAPSFPGWTLWKAARIAAGLEILNDYMAARRAWKKDGGPRRRNFGSVLIDYQAAREFIADGNRRKALRHQLAIAERAVLAEIRNELTAGRLVAVGRRGSPLAKLEWIPSSAWSILNILNPEKSTAQEPAPANSVIYDIRVFSADEAPKDLEGLIEPPDNTDELAELVRQDHVSLVVSNEHLGPEEACYQRLCVEMRKSPNQTVKPKKAWLEEAKSKFDGLTDRAFLRAWDRALRETAAVWARAGRPAKRA